MLTKTAALALLSSRLASAELQALSADPATADQGRFDRDTLQLIEYSLANIGGTADGLIALPTTKAKTFNPDTGLVRVTETSADGVVVSIVDIDPDTGVHTNIDPATGLAVAS